MVDEAKEREGSPVRVEEGGQTAPLNTDRCRLGRSWRWGRRGPSLSLGTDGDGAREPVSATRGEERWDRLTGRGPLTVSAWPEVVDFGRHHVPGWRKMQHKTILFRSPRAGGRRTRVTNRGLRIGIIGRTAKHP